MWIHGRILGLCGAISACCWAGAPSDLLAADKPVPKAGKALRVVIPPSNARAEYFQRVARFSLDECVGDLKRNGEGYAHSLMGIDDGFITLPMCHLKQVIKDQRVMRMYTLLKKMPNPEATQVINDLYQEASTRHFEYCHNSVREIVDGSEIYLTHYYLSAITFLSIPYCSIEETLRRLDLWDAEMTPLRNKPTKSMDSQDRFDLDYLAAPDHLLKANLYCYLLLHHKRATPEQVQQAIRLATSAPDVFKPYPLPLRQRTIDPATNTLISHTGLTTLIIPRMPDTTPESLRDGVLERLRALLTADQPSKS